MSAGRLAERVGAGRTLLGGLLRDPALAEAAVRAGLDIVVVEAGGEDAAALRHRVAAARRAAGSVLVRARRPGDVVRALEAGADGLLTAGADESAEAEAAVRARGGPGTVVLTERRDAAGPGEAVVVADAEQARAALAAGARVVVYDLDRAVGDLLGDLARVGAPVTARRPAGEPLVVLSGMLGDVTCWDEVAALLMERVTVRHARIDLDDSVAGLAAGVLAATPGRFALAGHSLGGIVAMEIMRQAPERVTRLALLNTSAGAGSPAQLAAWAELATRVERGEFAAVAAELARATLPAVRRGDAELVARNERMAATVGPDGLLRQLRAQATRPDSAPSLPAIAVPTLVLSGELDEVSPPPLQKAMAELIPGARHEVIAGCGHMAPLERPVEVAAHLREWLTW
ncbi:alpha/beta fold hydrolase [Thermomonospora catenispora]|uniref:alpha/beta fold hydrolase n=1 Tax=Thermomonospora catenispora TaxID=2493090 RepID=UPI00111DAD7A|nr:alpha/beta fold hydrolase [Thermomonospora catenispora]TNY35496.1 alpha/beta fold hydrolase [Thermomonospora catenispora]